MVEEFFLSLLPSHQLIISVIKRCVLHSAVAVDNGLIKLIEGINGFVVFVAVDYFLKPGA